MNTNTKLIEDEIDEALENEVSNEISQEDDQPQKGQKVKGYLVGPSVGTRVNREEWGLLLYLKRRYGVDQVSEALRQAIYDAVTLAQQESEIETGQKGSPEKFAGRDQPSSYEALIEN